MADQWILDLTKKLQLPQNPPDQQLCSKSIYRVPKFLTDVNSQAYEPKLASFGPYHHDCSHLRPMEKHKHRALVQFLRRIAKSSKTPHDVLIAMRKVEPYLIASYEGLQVEEADKDCLERDRFRRHDWLKEKDEFLKLMIVDGCFALEIMLANKRFAVREQSEEHSYDPIFESDYVVHYLKRDMLLLENQLPLLALTTLIAIDGSGIEDVNTLIKTFYNLSSTSREDLIIDEGLNGPTERSFHILDMYRKILTSEGDYLPRNEQNIQSVTKLRNAGVSFCKSNKLQRNVRADVSAEHWLYEKCAYPEKQLFDWGMMLLRHHFSMYGIGDTYAMEVDDRQRKKRDAERLSRHEEEERIAWRPKRGNFLLKYLMLLESFNYKRKLLRNEENRRMMAFRQRQRGTRAEKLRIQALKADDQEAYMRLVEESKNERLTMFLGKTNELLVCLGAAVQRQKDAEHFDDLEAFESFRAC